MFTYFYFRFPTDGPRKSDEFTLGTCRIFLHLFGPFHRFRLYFDGTQSLFEEECCAFSFQGVSKTEDEEFERTLRYSESYLQQLAVCFRTPTNLRNLIKDHFRSEINIISLLNLLFFYMKWNYPRIETIYITYERIRIWGYK